ncbi:Hpt domain-containing protein [Rugamonas sp. A1-17]|nr:Hpt domain-containing protein [Rugamonas sp. A1-17]
MSSAYRVTAPGVLWQAAGADLQTFRALAQTFLDHAPPLQARLEQALRLGSPAAIAAASHALKGMTVLVGAERLSALLQALERQARAGVAPAPDAGLAPLCGQVMDEVALSMARYDGVEDDR